MKIITLYIALLTVVLFLIGCSSNQEENLKTTVLEGTYELANSIEIITPYIKLMKDGTFIFEYNVLMSTVLSGSYEVSENTLILNRQETETKYVFTINQSELVFVKDKSSELVLFKTGQLSDGSVFQLVQ